MKCPLLSRVARIRLNKGRERNTCVFTRWNSPDLARRDVKRDSCPLRRHDEGSLPPRAWRLGIRELIRISYFAPRRTGGRRRRGAIIRFSDAVTRNQFEAVRVSPWYTVTYVPCSSEFCTRYIYLDHSQATFESANILSISFQSGREGENFVCPTLVCIWFINNLYSKITCTL